MYDPQGFVFPLNGGKSPANTLHIIGRGDTVVSMGQSTEPNLSIQLILTKQTERKV